MNKRRHRNQSTPAAEQGHSILHGTAIVDSHRDLVLGCSQSCLTSMRHVRLCYWVLSVSRQWSAWDGLCMCASLYEQIFVHDRTATACACSCQGTNCLSDIPPLTASPASMTHDQVECDGSHSRGAVPEHSSDHGKAPNRPSTHHA